MWRIGSKGDRFKGRSVKRVFQGREGRHVSILIFTRTKMVACAIVSGQGLRLKVKGIRKTGIVEDRFKGLRFKWR